MCVRMYTPVRAAACGGTPAHWGARMVSRLSNGEGDLPGSGGTASSREVSASSLLSVTSVHSR